MAEYIEKQAALKEVCDACGIVHDREKENCEYKFAGCKEYYNVFALPPADVVSWVYLERYAEWFCADVSFPEFVREAKAFLGASGAFQEGGEIYG